MTIRWHDHTRKWHDRVCFVQSRTVSSGMAVRESGAAMPSFTSTVLSKGVDEKTEYAAKFAATGIYGGGSDPVC